MENKKECDPFTTGYDWARECFPTEQQMGSHHHQVAILVPYDKLDCFRQLENFLLGQKRSGFLSGTIAAI